MSSLADRLQDLIENPLGDQIGPHAMDLLREVHEELAKVARKVRTIHLTHDLSAGTYRVVKVTDSVTYRPGEFLEKDVVGALCDDAAWKVTVLIEK